jgi:heat-inducible transcriptional repressor
MSRTVRLLAQLTKQVALVQYPSLTRSSVRHIELVAVSPARLLVIVIADTGRIEQRMVEIRVDLSESAIADLRVRLNAAASGLLMRDVPNALVPLADSFPNDVRDSVRAVVATIIESTVAQNEERLVIAGTSNLARSGDDFTSSVGPVLDALEEHVVLLRLLGETTATGDISVRIGAENQVEELQTASIVSASYGSADNPVAHLGVLGPTRMDYAGSMGAVRAVARYVGHILMEQ